MNISKIVTIILLIGFLCYLVFFVIGVEKPTPSTSVNISGVVTNHIGDTIKFFAPDTTYITTLDTTTGEFSITFDWDTTAQVSFFHGVESTAMYLKPSDNINLTIDTDQFDESITYTGSDESSFLAWQYMYEENSEMPNPLKLPREKIDSFFNAIYVPILAEAEKFKEFNPHFYQTIVDEKEKGIAYVRNRLEVLANLPQQGESSIDFTYPDKDGNDVSLSDFVGSVVYVDVWATWCGPCRAQIPFLHDLEEEYRDKNVTFVGVSLDIEKNRQSWLDMMVEKEMKGVQIFADGWSQITKDYAINSIPRFMLFDSEGKVSDLDASRPSSEDIRPALDALLVK
jgi:thiol-disulfide isomerase/thioredoxin